MSQTTEITPERKAELDAQRAERVAKSKILNNGVQSPQPFGIMDILFWNRQTNKTTRYTGNEQTEDAEGKPVGQIMFMMPFRTLRDLSRHAIYSIPSNWKIKFHKGQQVYPVIDQNGYISKLIPATSMGSTNAFVSTNQALAIAAQNAAKDFDTAPENVQAPAPETKAPEVPTGSADGFEDDADGPF